MRIDFSSICDLLLHTLYALLENEYPIDVHLLALLLNFFKVPCVQCITLAAKNTKICNVRGLMIVKLKRNFT